MGEKKQTNEELLAAALDRISVLESKQEGKGAPAPSLPLPKGAKRYYITAPHFMQQVGESVSRYIGATPEQPVVVVLEEMVTRKDKDGGSFTVPRPTTRHLKLIKPKKPVDTVKGGQPSAMPKNEPANKGGKRAADQ